MRSPLAIAALLSLAPAAASADRLDDLFAGLGPTTPGCAVGIEQAGAPAILRAYGSADLEHGVANTPQTVFEAGSVSKQFTAAAVLLLAGEGRISLDDDIRRYLPELPDYGTSITIDELLTHTSGLRDWGEIEDAAGWPRGERLYGLSDVLAIAARQGALNHRPGAHWSYTNTGYNFAAVLVERVSGQSLASFSQARIFRPLVMAHTQWRDDFRRVVPGRAVAYEADGRGFEQDMPFEDAYGNGGLLTTVGDLLIWNRALADARLGRFVTDAMQAPAKLADGRPLAYARGLYVQSHGGQREIAHSGATAGYRAWLGRYPQRRLSIALLCNDGALDPTRLAHQAADLYLPPSRPPSPPPPEDQARLAGRAGLYVDERWGETLRLVVRGGRLGVEDGPDILTAPGGGYLLGARPLAFRADGALELNQAGEPIVYRLAPPAGFDAAVLAAAAGRYRSEEAGADYELRVVPRGLSLSIRQRPGRTVLLTPAYGDVLYRGEDLLRLIRDRSGAVTGISLSSPRLWDLRARRTGPAAPTAQAPGSAR